MNPRAHKAKLIFISYRRDDASSITLHLYDRLKRRFGGNVFMDVFSTRAPDIITERLAVHLGGCSVALVVIGKRWLNAATPRTRRGGKGLPPSPRTRRLDEEGDLVRWEIKTVLDRGITVITLLVEGADFPPQGQLPPELAELKAHDWIRIRGELDFERDFDELVRAIEENLYGKLRRGFRNFYFRHEHKMTVLGSITMGLIFTIVILSAAMTIIALTPNLKQTVTLSGK